MRKLAVLVPFHAGEESVTSFCSRIAAANGDILGRIGPISEAAPQGPPHARAGWRSLPLFQRRGKDDR